MTTLTLAHTIAGHLGQGWHAYTGKAADGSEAHLAGPNDQVLDLFDGTSTGRKADQGRLIITGYLGFLRNHVPTGMQRDHTITVDEAKPPDRIAREIRRRLLPDYQAALSAAWDAKHASEATAAAREQLAATVAASLGVQRDMPDTDFHFGTVDVGVHGRVSVRPGTSDSVFTVHVPHDRVAEFARLLNTFGRPH